MCERLQSNLYARWSKFICLSLSILTFIAAPNRRRRRCRRGTEFEPPLQSVSIQSMRLHIVIVDRVHMQQFDFSAKTTLLSFKLRDITKF